MKIVSLKMTNFKGTTQAEHHFGAVNKIAGDNYSGKTTIAEAILFALYGVNMDGSNRTTNLIHQGEKKAFVSVRVDIDGVIHTIDREGTATQKIVYLNGNEVSQGKVEQTIGPLDRFMACFNPISTIGKKDADAREFFVGLLRRIEPSEVITSLDEPYQQMLVGLDLINPELRKKELREQIAEEEKNQQWAEGAISVHTMTLNEVPSKVIDTSELKKKLAELEEELLAITNDKPTPIDTLQMEREIADLQRELANQTISRSVLKDTTALEKQIASLRGDYASLQRQFENLEVKFSVGDTCPTCTQAIEEEAFSRFTHEVDNQKVTFSAKLEAIKEEGIGLKAQLELIQSSNLLAQEEAERKVTNARAKIEAELNELLRKLEITRTQNRNNESLWLDNLNKKSKDLRDRQELLLSLIREAELSNADRETVLARIEQAKIEIKKLKESLPKSVNTIKDAKQKIEVINLFIAKHAELLAEQIEQYFDRASLQLFEVVKSTGEIKPVFKLLYDNKPIGILSMSERIRLGLEVSEVVKKLSGVQYPTFVDNAESITHFNTPSGQLFTATVVQGEKIKLEVA